MQTRRDLAAQLARRRRELGLTQSALADASGVPQPQLSLIENAAVTPRLDTLLALMLALRAKLALVPEGYVVAPQALVDRALELEAELTDSSPVRSAVVAPHSTVITRRLGGVLAERR